MRSKIKNYKKYLLLLLVIFIYNCSTFNSTDKVDIVLEIKPRIQWDNDGGYCGSSTIQQIALNYGTYISQDLCRKAIGNEEILLGINAYKVLEELSFEYDNWNPINFIPQSKKYTQWIKENIKKNYPVMIGVYTRNGNNKWYDHIIPVTGYISSDDNTNNDYLLFNSCWDNKIYSFKISEMINTRKNSCIKKKFSIPKYVNFGCAILGIKDPLKITKPVRIITDNNYEPNTLIGEFPVSINGQLEISDLEINKKYIVFRYNNYKDLPEDNYQNSEYKDYEIFTSEGISKKYDIEFMSNSFTSYRCIEYIGFTI